MKLIGKFRLAGVLARPGFRDSSRMTYQALFVDGVDSIRIWLDGEQYDSLSHIEPYTEVEVVFDFNPVTNRLNLVNVC